MSKILLIIKREYWTRVRKRSFIIMTLLGPLLMAGIGIVPIWLSQNSKSEKKILVIDEDGLFKDHLQNNKFLFFFYSNADFNNEKQNVKEGGYDGMLRIPKLDLQKPDGITYYSESSVGIEIQSYLKSEIERVIVEKKYAQMGFNKHLIDQLKTKIPLKTVDLSGETEKETSSIAATAFGLIMAIIIYMFIFIYGAQVMRGVMEEKSSRVIEVMISSVKPFQLMMGKVLGIALVALTQFMIWVSASLIIYVTLAASFGFDRYNNDNLTSTLAAPGMDQVQAMQMNQFLNAIGSLNFPLIIGAFLFFFMAGYLFYAALFAAIGSAVDNDSDTQQFMLPITVPLILAFMVVQSILENPDGATGFWFSIIPLTSPIVMMVRVPFLGAHDYWELALSMVLLVAGFIGTIWLAGRIYRVGILMHGKKVNYAELAKWLFYKE